MHLGRVRHKAIVRVFTILSPELWLRGLVGASGGDYCLIFAMFANTILNCGHMKWYWLLIRIGFRLEKFEVNKFREKTQNSENDQRFLPIAAFVTNDVIVTLDMISNDVKIRTSWAAHLGGAFAGWVKS